MRSGNGAAGPWTLRLRVDVLPAVQPYGGGAGAVRRPGREARRLRGRRSRDPRGGGQRPQLRPAPPGPGPPGSAGALCSRGAQAGGHRRHRALFPATHAWACRRVAEEAVRRRLRHERAGPVPPERDRPRGSEEPRSGCPVSPHRTLLLPERGPRHLPQQREPRHSEATRPCRDARLSGSELGQLGRLRRGGGIVADRGDRAASGVRPDVRRRDGLRTGPRHRDRVRAHAD